MDQAAVEQMLAAIAPGGIETALQASAASATADREEGRALELALERARCKAQGAWRLYDLANPENRLMAGELETHWNWALRCSSSHGVFNGCGLATGGWLISQELTGEVCERELNLYRR